MKYVQMNIMDRRQLFHKRRVSASIAVRCCVDDVVLHIEDGEVDHMKLESLMADRRRS